MSKISDVIKRLEELKSKHGDIIVVTRKYDPYWGDVDKVLDIQTIYFTKSAAPQGVKADVDSEQGVVVDVIL